MSTNYKIIQDENKLKDFIKWLPELTNDETYLVCLFARKKYLNNTPYDGQLNADKGQLKRFTSDKKFLFQKIKNLEVEIGSYLYEGKPIPQEALAVYITVNPRSQRKAGIILLKELADVLTDNNRNNYNVHKMALNATQKASSRKVFMDFDVDGKTVEEVLPEIYGKVNQDCIHILKTRGGFHLLIETSKIDKEYEKTWYNNLTKISGIDVCNADLQPCPGTYQGGYSPTLFSGDEVKKLLPYEENEDLDKEEPYCLECGCEELDYITTYANGDEYHCVECGHEAVWPN